MKTVRLVTELTGLERTVALRATAPSLAPGESGVFAIVADKRAFMEEGGMTNLILEVYRHDGIRQAVVPLAHQLTGE